MNFVIVTPEHMTLQIQLQTSDPNHARHPRCTQAWSPENLSHSCCKLARNLLRQFLSLGRVRILEFGRRQGVVTLVLEQVSRRRVRGPPKRLGHAFDMRGSFSFDRIVAH
jgi:hypothetical protein